MTILAQPALALVFGLVIICGGTCLEWREWLSLPRHWSSLPFLIDDWVIGLALVFGAMRTHRDWSTGRPYQAAAWAFNAGVLYVSFFGHLENAMATRPAEGPIPEAGLTTVIGLLLTIAIGGLVATLASAKSPQRQGQ